MWKRKKEKDEIPELDEYWDESDLEIPFDDYSGFKEPHEWKVYIEPKGYLELSLEKIENGILVTIKGKKHHIDNLWDLPNLIDGEWKD